MMRALRATAVVLACTAIAPAARRTSGLEVTAVRYWSLDGAVAVLGMDSAATAIAVQWPGGKTTETPVPRGAREVSIKAVP